MQQMENLQWRLEAFTELLSFIHDDALNAAKNMAVALDIPALRQANMLAQSCTPGTIKRIQQQLLNDFAPLTELSSKIVGQIPSWTQALFDTAVFQREDLWLAREEGISRWSDAIGRISEIGVPYEWEPDEIDELSDEESNFLQRKRRLLLQTAGTGNNGLWRV